MAFFPGVVAYTKSSIDRVKGMFKSFMPARISQVAVFDNAITTNLFAMFNILDVHVTLDKSIASHPLEINQYLQDNVVYLPKVITLTVAAEAPVLAELYSQLFDMFNDPTAMFAISVDSMVHDNMVLKTQPVQRDASKFDVIEIPLEFHEFIFGRVNVSAMADSENTELAQYSDRQQKGFQKGSQISGQDQITREAIRTVPVKG